MQYDTNGYLLMYRHIKPDFPKQFQFEIFLLLAGRGRRTRQHQNKQKLDKEEVHHNIDFMLRTMHRDTPAALATYFLVTLVV